MAGRACSVVSGASLLALAVALGPLPACADTPSGPASADAPAAADGRDPRGGTEADFDPAFFRRGASSPSVDVSRYENGNPVAAGRYRVDLSLNGTFLARVEIAFDASDSDQTAQPCLDEALLDKIGIDLTRLTPQVLARLRAAPGACLPLAIVVPDAVSRFDIGDQTLDISIPQALLRNAPRGYVDPRFWDQGITAAKLGYNFNLFNTTGRAGGTQGYLGVNAGFNIGGWRFRHDGALTFGSGERVHYQGSRTYAQRDMTSLQSQLTIGDAFTDGQVFDTLGYRGVSIATDDQMLPESMRGYAPVVRGTARTNANVVIRQNGNLIYQATVAPGPFEIKDLYATGYGGDLVVTVNEADGQVETFTVPFASIPQLLRKGTVRFSVTLGEVRDGYSSQHPFLFQVTGQRGISNAITGYSGVVMAGSYNAVLGGIAVNTRLGALGFDLTLADAGLPGIDSNGASLRVSYAHLFSATGTNFTVAAYRYSSKGFWSLQSALSARRDAGPGVDLNDIDRPRNSFQLSVSQPLGRRWGSLYLTGSTQQYWNRRGSTTYYQAGYSNVFKGVGYSLSASRQTDILTGRPDTRFMFSLNFVAGHGRHAPSVTSSMTAGGSQPFQAQTTLSGSLGDNNDLSYGATYTHSDDTNSASGTLQYQGRAATLNGSVGVGNGYTQQSFGASGTVVIHSGGVTLGGPSADPIGLVSAPGAGGARVSSSSGARVDGNGYAIVPYLMPYMRNTVEIDPKGLNLDVELNETSQTVTPREGAIVRLTYGSVTGRAAILTVRMADGGVIPFGASVLTPDGATIGQAGQAGGIFVRGVGDSGSLIVRWGDGPDERCHLDYRLPPRVAGAAAAYDHAKAVCTVLPPLGAPPITGSVQ
jgi:outer membrane usher protein